MTHGRYSAYSKRCICKVRDRLAHQIPQNDLELAGATVQATVPGHCVVHAGGDHLALMLLKSLKVVCLLPRIPRKAVKGILTTQLHIIDFVNHPLQSNVTQLEVIFIFFRAISWDSFFSHMPTASDVSMIARKPHLLDAFLNISLLL